MISAFYVFLKNALPIHLLGILRQKKYVEGATAVENKLQSNRTLLNRWFWIGLEWCSEPLYLRNTLGSQSPLWFELVWSRAGAPYSTYRRASSMLTAEGWVVSVSFLVSVARLHLPWPVCSPALLGSDPDSVTVDSALSLFEPRFAPLPSGIMRAHLPYDSVVKIK